MKTLTETESVAETVPTRIDEVQAAAAKVAALHQKMTCLTTLTPEQRADQIGRGIGVRKLQLLQNRVEAARANRALLPVSFDLAQLEHDAALTAALIGFVAILTELQEDAADTLREVGNRAVLDAETAHAYVKVASKRSQRVKPTENQRKSRASSMSDPPPLVVPVPAPPAGPAVTVNVPVNPSKQAA